MKAPGIGVAIAAVAILGAALMLTRVSASSPAIPTTAAAAPNPFKGNEQPITRSSDGNAPTGWFYLVGGDYTVTWQTNGNPIGCYYSGNLLERFGDGQADLGRGIFFGPGPHTTQIAAASLPNGDYFLNVISGCSWSVTISPI